MNRYLAAGLALGWLAGVATSVAIQSRAGEGRIELGAALGSGRTYAPTHYQAIETHVRDTSAVGQLFVGLRARWNGVEGGWLDLPRYRSRVRTEDYPTYKGLAAGTYPQTVEGQQDINARALYGRVNLYLPLGRLAPYLFVGRARVTTWNYERAVYNGADEADFHQILRRSANLAGIGIAAELTPRLSIRIEALRIPNGTVDYHTLSRTYTLATVGLAVGF